MPPQVENGQSQFHPQRPKPQFDMNLKELFSDDMLQNHRFRVSIDRVPYLQQDQLQQPQAQSAYSQQQQQQQQHVGSPNSQYATSVRSSVSPSSAFAQPTSVPAYAYDPSLSPHNSQTSGIMDSMPYSSLGPTSYPQSGPFSNHDLDGLLMDATAAYTGHADLNMNFDGGQDWNVEPRDEMFGAFFFGGPGIQWEVGGGTPMDTSMGNLGSANGDMSGTI